ncbi:MAG TPA: hypothetical protein VEI97_08405 [bacterium]|nr:hypothetical protein [bacterium]
MKRVRLAVLLVLVCTVALLTPSPAPAEACPTICAQQLQFCMNRCFSGGYPGCSGDCFDDYDRCCGNA